MNIFIVGDVPLHHALKLPKMSQSISLTSMTASPVHGHNDSTDHDVPICHRRPEILEHVQSRWL
jgi:hypothetical protein